MPSSESASLSAGGGRSVSLFCFSAFLLFFFLDLILFRGYFSTNDFYPDSFLEICLCIQDLTLEELKRECTKCTKKERERERERERKREQESEGKRERAFGIRWNQTIVRSNDSQSARFHLH